MIAALQVLRAQEIGDLVGAARQRREGQFCLAVRTGIDDPERGAVPALGLLRKLRVEPIERPVERSGVGPAEAFDGRVVIGAMLEQKGARFLKGGHRLFPARLLTCRIIPEKSTPPCPAASNSL